jgi:hypothetical protein
MRAHTRTQHTHEQAHKRCALGEAKQSIVRPILCNVVRRVFESPVDAVVDELAFLILVELCACVCVCVCVHGILKVGKRTHT